MKRDRVNRTNRKDATTAGDRVTADMRCDDDPSFSYVVIEHRLGLEGQADFIRIQEALSGLKKKIIRQEVVRDPASGENRLVIQMKYQETEEIMLTLLGSSLKRDFCCYVYKSAAAGFPMGR